MKIDKDDVVSNDKKSLLQQTTPAVPQVQRVKHPTLAIAVYRILVPADSAIDRIFKNLLKSEPIKNGSGKTTLAKADVDLYPPVCRLMAIEELDEIKLPLNRNRNRLPTRLVVALFLLVAASVAGFLASHSPF